MKSVSLRLSMYASLAGFAIPAVGEMNWDSHFGILKVRDPFWLKPFWRRVQVAQKKRYFERSVVMGRRLFLLAVPAVFVGVVVMKVLDAVSAMAYDKQLQFNDASCSLLQAPIPCEDISAFGDGHSAFAGCGDLWSTLMNGSESAKDGAIYLVNATKGDMRRLPIDFDGSALPFKLVTHGIFYSQRSMRLYVVNHDELAGESVEIFDVVGQGPSLKLRHTRTIRSPLFGNMALNDVVEGETDEIYVTEWQPFPFPSGGRAGMATAPLGVKLQLEPDS